MNTLLALLIMFMACTMGLIAIAIVMMIMGLAGAPGAMVFATGQKTRNVVLTACGFIIAALGQSYVVGACTVFLVSLLRRFSESRPDIPTWPLWIAAFIHSGAVPTYGMLERPEEPTAQHHTLGLVALLATAVFFIVVFVPNTLKPIYGWLPLYDTMLQHPGASNARQGNSESAPAYTLTNQQRESVRAFFAGYQYLQDMQVLVKAISSSRNPIEDLNHIESLTNKALERLAECDIELLIEDCISNRKIVRGGVYCVHATTGDGGGVGAAAAASDTA
ncbi:MAG: hypothetical protein ABSA52_15440, partial [Candidatus Binatia bacterium]